MKKFLVRVDPDLSDLIPGFLAAKRRDVQVILRAITARDADFAELSRIGHRLKGEGGSYGFDAITAYGAELERAALDNQAEAVRRCAEELSAYLEAVEVVCE